MNQNQRRRSSSSSSNIVLAVDEDEEMFASDEFRMYGFKIKKCSRSRSHDWTDCPYAHKGEKATRRDPRKIPYSAVACPWYRTGSSCPNGELCDFAHGVFEYWLHPARYRTRPCNSGPFCQRKVCFFAHSPDQIRPHNKSNTTHTNLTATISSSSSSSSSATDSVELVYWTPMRMDGGSYFCGVTQFLDRLRELKIHTTDQQLDEEDDGAQLAMVNPRRGCNIAPPCDEYSLPEIDWVSDLVN
ncbi:Zinc finger CCCH domain-containing protein 54 [Linum perenne]